MNDPPLRIKHRFSSKRMEDLVLTLNDVQKGFVQKNGFGSLLEIKSFNVPVPLIEWIMEHMIVGAFQFKHRDKSIKFHPSMVKQVMGFESGSIPVELDSTDPILLSKVDEVMGDYIVSGKSPISVAVSKMEGDNNEASFMRSFMLVAIASVICPSTQNYVNLKYLNCLMDPSMIKEYDWVGHMLEYMGSEIKKFQGAVDSFDQAVHSNRIYIGSCLPLLAIVYIDFLDLLRDGNHHSISDVTPRICNVSSSDFEFAMKVDRNIHVPGKFIFGAIGFRDISCTPYKYHVPGVSADNHDNTAAAVGHVSNGANINPNVAGPFSGEDISENVDASIRPILTKYQESFKNEVLSTLLPSITGSVMQSIVPVFAKHMSQMCAEIYTNCMSVRANVNFPTPPSGVNVADSAVNGNTPLSDGLAVNLEPSVPPPVINDQSVGSGGFPEMSPANNITHLIAAQEDILYAANYGINAAISGFHDESFVSFSESGDESGGTSPERVTGHSTILKRKRKKRCLIYPDDSPTVNLTVTDEMEAVYAQYVSSVFIDSQSDDDMPPFVEIEGFNCSYLSFRSSLEPKGSVTEDFVGVYVQWYNHHFARVPDTKFSRQRVAFSPFLTSKLIIDPREYDVESTEAEITRINATFELMITDLFFFPFCINDKWVLICINDLFTNINVFDPANFLSSQAKVEMVKNVVTNFQRSCFAAKIFDRNLGAYKYVDPVCPKSKVHHALYVFLSMEFWDGKVLSKFGPSTANQFKKVLSHRIISSPLNKFRQSRED
ncbi:hypothetical protein EJB05_14551 [Eragrostis curvula]|uniref:Ubiquitin-like protease family profile domain-containing protein n=1 Tax=Eragrostis curvula TaxID=38414 RepID=A0A5J9W163_9POAL|nr:hypothetical protein EJB05_14551 [Eragrostis curvula]